MAHGVATGDKGYIQEITGIHLVSFIYLGAKHMFTGDHGWFFRNRNENDIVLKLKTRGDYGVLKKVI